MERKHGQVKMYGAFTLAMKGYFFLFFSTCLTYICLRMFSRPGQMPLSTYFLVALSPGIYINKDLGNTIMTKVLDITIITECCLMVLWYIIIPNIFPLLLR